MAAVSADRNATMPTLTVGILDVGSNSARLLVARVGRGGLRAVEEQKAYLRLGAEIERHGRIGPSKLEEAATVARGFAAAARKAGAEHVETLVTAPGRQAANADELVDVLAHASRTPVRVVGAEEEGVLAFRGALALEPDPAGTLAVCDVGGGSTEIVVGVADTAAVTWIRSVDLGSLRLTTACFDHDPPTAGELERAEATAADLLGDLDAPPVDAALAVGGSARALAKLAGPELSVKRLDAALEMTTARRSSKIAKAHALDEQRARVLPAGAIILRRLAAELGPLRPGRGGLREGAAWMLLEQSLAA
jgi:exopolyphosphatase/guanosine-5'-triphosphate,3'-diphosphate pyrophosphatase